MRYNPATAKAGGCTSNSSLIKLVRLAIWALEIFFQWQQALLWITGKFWRLSLIVNMLRLLPIGPIPTNTMRVAEAAIPEGNTYLKLRNALGTVFDDALFSPLFASRGQPAAAPWRLALVTIMQFAEGLSDRDAADAVRTRIDWKYLLGLELSDPGFNYSILSRFRARLVENNAETSLLQGLLERCHDLGLVRERSDMRTDSTHIIASIRDMNRLELVGETLRAALNVLATVDPAWLCTHVESDWYVRYAKRFVTTALLVFLSRAARARVVPPDLGSIAPWFTRAGTRTDLPMLSEIPIRTQ